MWTGVGTIALGVVLLAYLVYAVVLYFNDLTDGFTQVWTNLFYYPASTILVPDYLGWFFLALLLPVLVTLAFAVPLYHVIKHGRVERRRLIAAGVLLAIVSVAQFFVPPVADSTVSYGQYVDRVGALKKFQDRQAELQPGVQKPTDAELHAGALQQLILASVIEQEATKYNVSVSSKEINDFYNSQAERSQGKENLEKQLKELLGWTPDQFKQEVRLRLLQEKLNQKLGSDEEVNKDRKEKADKFLERVKNGEDFATVAKESDDPTASAGGDQGTVKRGELDPAVEEVAFNLNVGQVSEVIKTDQGYVIVKVTEKPSNDEIKISQISVRTQSLTEFLPDELKKTRISIFVHGLVWDNSLFAVQPKDPQDVPDPAATATPAAGDAAATPAAQ